MRLFSILVIPASFQPESMEGQNVLDSGQKITGMTTGAGWMTRP